MLVEELTNKTRISPLIPKPCLESTHKPCFYFLLIDIKIVFPRVAARLTAISISHIRFSMLIFRLSNIASVGQRTSLLRWESKLQFFPRLLSPSNHPCVSSQGLCGVCVIMQCFISYLKTLPPPSTRRLCPKTWREVACDTSAHQLYGSPCRRRTSTNNNGLYASCRHCHNAPPCLKTHHRPTGAVENVRISDVKLD